MTVRYEVADGVATLTLASPETRNRLSADTLAVLTGHLGAAADDDGVRVVVLTAEGTTFCAGADLAAAVGQQSGGFADTGPQAYVGVLEAMLDHPKPIVARVQGHVAGGGNGLVAAADIAVAAVGALFAFGEVRLGVVPAVVSVVCLDRMHPAHARALLLTGERVSAQRAREAGLVLEVAEDEALDAVVAAHVAALRLGGPEALRRTKELLRSIRALSRDEAFATAAAVSVAAFGSDEGREGMSAYLAGTTPRWVPPAG
jgi:methylglutaconyl-CoA hydratase